VFLDLGLSNFRIKNSKRFPQNSGYPALVLNCTCSVNVVICNVLSYNERIVRMAVNRHVNMFQLQPKPTIRIYIFFSE
jgi:hypothetical protein